ncbi:hypothetical protein [Bullifex porci]|uniref:hypothetical protein n=1 Tax=Bullifex porci TaxID=2606638 RepID=UPI0023F110B3|nr:hypothetical protein [Bullifex porci]MDD7255632.1 hypothetical protein [Bullifex porci]
MKKREFNEMELQIVDACINGFFTKYRAQKILGISNTKLNEIINKQKEKKALIRK